MARRLQRMIPKEFAERLLATRGKVERERRLVTILFSDVKGSTAMAEKLDPEEVMEIMDGAFDFLIEPIYQHEGTLARLMGDAILAFFGAPISHEDDPERAVRAALDILEESKAYASKLEQEWGIKGFNVRVGIHTGLVVVGEVGSDLRVEYTAMGDAINLASRLEQNAPVGGVLISADTYQHIRGLFDVQALEPLSVKGKTEPVRVYEVLRARRDDFYREGRGVHGVRTQLIGRQMELSILQDAFAGLVENGATKTITVVGDAGMGKTRLLQEFEGCLEGWSEAHDCCRGRALPTTMRTPYGVLRDLFCRRFSILDSDRPAEVQVKFERGTAPYLEPRQAHLVGYLVGLGFEQTAAVRDLAASSSLAGEARIHLTTYFLSLAKERPLLVLLEDLHWADELSLNFFTDLVETAERLLVIGLTRPTLYERATKWGLSHRQQRMDLLPLAENDSQALVRAILEKVADLPGEMQDLIVRGAEGNPYYIEELIVMLMGDGVIVVDGDAWRVEMERLKNVRVPTTLTGVLQARLDSLPEAEKQILQRAAVVGRRFWDVVVDRMGGLDGEPDGVVELLQSLLGRQLIFPERRSVFAGVNEYLFKHAVLRDVTYETVLLKLRRVYHQQVAEWLEVNCMERLEEYAEVIAGHYEAAREPAKAVTWLRKAGRAAQRFSAFHDALDLYGRALALLPETDLAERAQILVHMGDSHEKLSQYAQASECLRMGADLARKAGDWTTLASALITLSWITCIQGAAQEGYDLAEQALAMARQGGDGVMVAHALIRVADEKIDANEERQYLEEALALFKAASDRSGEATCLLNLGNLTYHQDDFEAARGYYEESLAIYRQIGDRWGINNCLGNLGGVDLAIENYAQASRYYQEALEIANEIGDRECRSIWFGNLSRIAVLQNDDDLAVEYLRQALAESYDIGVMWLTLDALAQFADIYARNGDVVRAAEYLGLAKNHPGRGKYWEAEAAEILDRVGAALGEIEFQAALERGAAADLERVVESLLGRQS
ncbi:MAG: adenylate/guanylate cyclase domain-containing protein [Chloroflexota bacterium]